MARISIGTLDKAAAVSPPPAYSGAAETRAYFDRDADPLHLHLHRIGLGDRFRIGPMATDCAVYVWQGSVATGRITLSSGSSLIVEHGAALEISGASEDTVLLTFAARQPSADIRAGGQIHLLPHDRVPRYAPEPDAGGASGGLHADAECPTCEVWLHENSLPGMPGESALAVAERGAHSHAEDEIIFVTGGSIRLGTRLCGPGTALAIAARTIYSFTPGPDGLSFINFRAARSREIIMKHGGTMDEAAYWNERVSAPRYLAPKPA